MSQQEETLQDHATREAARGEQPKALGLLRWVQMAFMVIALLFLWVFDRVITLVWTRFAEPNPVAVTAVAFALAVGTTLYLYRHERINRVTHEIVGELAKVSWPSREETQVSTVVVIIASIIAAAIVGAFDAAWSWLTDFIYKV